jgi:hypothetical protein
VDLYNALHFKKPTINFSGTDSRKLSCITYVYKNISSLVTLLKVHNLYVKNRLEVFNDVQTTISKSIA